MTRPAFERERHVAELLDPRNGFERTTVAVETRRDPLTGQSCRILPAGSFPPPALHDLDDLAARTRESCPFCGSRVEEVTPRFPPEVWPEGRIRRGEALLFPNLVPYAKWSAVSIYSPERHRCRSTRSTPRVSPTTSRTQVAFARAVPPTTPAPAWVCVNANQRRRRGARSSIRTSRASAHPVPTNAQRLLAGGRGRRPAAPTSRRSGSGRAVLASRGGVDWLAGFAPARAGRGDARHWRPPPRRSSSTRRRSPSSRAASRRRPRVYAELGFESFNLALYGTPTGGVLGLRVVARAYDGPAGRSDAMWSERLHWEAATDVAPEAVAELARARF